MKTGGLAAVKCRIFEAVSEQEDAVARAVPRHV